MRIRLRSVVAAGVAAALVAVAYVALTDHPPAPDATFVLLSGRKLTTTQLRGKVYLVNFWATSCATCIKEMPQMIQTDQRFKGRDFAFVAVAMSYDPPDFVEQYARTRRLPFDVARDADGSAARAFFGVRMTPTTFLVDKRGRILKRILGEPDFPELHRLIRRELAAS
ncbi:putative thioredoxin [Thiomonas arsenitoxydans]|uniref:Thioredoxin n=2 Tax=Thiomonas TaxID=32012 RepID=D6CMC4_THIA3|nr:MULTISPECIES: TlpA disulfide reductase family protein [Thiomonas]CQR45665.1 putative thioredoxin [Thiomonas sp. CB3]CAZ89702.1 putative thioredoxin [Thiomonas arsenitoxydans]CDW96196.1 putative thioredoxin [Thiomonas sp. CB2]CQR31373.1 putative thioredoxin [Thiomonas arsenitoxydans]CQR36059.1 putative thioredoxin [Thiomonas arsenitoxydans]